MARIIKAVEGELVFGRKVSLLSECGLEAVEFKRSEDELSSGAREGRPGIGFRHDPFGPHDAE